MHKPAPCLWRVIALYSTLMCYSYLICRAAIVSRSGLLTNRAISLTVPQECLRARQLYFVQESDKTVIPRCRACCSTQAPVRRVFMCAFVFPSFSLSCWLFPIFIILASAGFCKIPGTRSSTRSPMSAILLFSLLFEIKCSQGKYSKTVFIYTCTVR